MNSQTPTAQPRDPLVSSAKALQRAEELLRANQPERAKTICEGLVKEFPDYVGALHTLGLTLATMKDFEGSAAILSKAAMLCPTDWRILTALSTVNLQLKRASAAIFNLEQAQKLKPDDPAILGTLAETYRDQKEYELAMTLFERAIASGAESPQARLLLADCYENLGRLEDAAKIYEALLAEGQSVPSAVGGLAQLPQSLTSCDVLARLKELESAPEPVAVRLQFVRGLGLHRAGRHAEAWEQLLAANEPKRRAMAEEWQSGAGYRQRVTEFARSVPRLDPRPRDAARPVSLFILGPSRSGKTTLERLLAALPDLKRGYENPIVENAVRRTLQISGCITRSGINGMPTGLDSAFTGFYVEELTERAAGAKVFTNTHPAKITEALRYARVIPNARFLFVKRNANDLILRTLMKNYSSGNSYAYDVKTIKEHMDWYYGFIDICAEKLPGISRVIDYDDFVADPKAGLCAAQELCGLDGEFGPIPQTGDDRGVAEPYAAMIAEALRR